MGVDQLAASRIILCSLVAIASAASMTPQPACNYRLAQQLFDLAKFSLDGCTRLSSLVQIFGDGSTAGSSVQAQKLTATRFITASVVFTGSITHVLKDPAIGAGTAYEIVVQPRCFLKGQLPAEAGGVTLSGLLPSIDSGLCLPINAEVGDSGLFFATVEDDAKGSARVLINENGFVREGEELRSALASLRCRENAQAVTPIPARGGAGDGGDVVCRPIGASEPPCAVSLDAAAEFLHRAFIVYETDLKPECQLGQDLVMQRIVKAPATAADDSKACRSQKPQQSTLIAAVAILLCATVRHTILV